jgi:hypothetical protein
MARLMKLMGWDEPETVVVRDRFVEVLEAARRRPGPHSYPAGSDSAGAAVEGRKDTNLTSPAANDHSTTAQPLLHLRSTSHSSSLTPRQEAFARARCHGMGVMEAYKAAGYPGVTANLAWRLHAMPAVRDRIRELNRDVEKATGYRRQHAIQDLVSIVHARPSEASPKHPLCEMRMTSWGEYHRFPSKLGAMVLLASLLGWHDPEREEEPPDPDAKFRALAEFIRRRK